MDCPLCHETKTPSDYPSQIIDSAKLPGEGLPHDELTFVCFQCLASHNLVTKAKDLGSISEEVFASLQVELDEVKRSREASMACHAHSSLSSGHVMVSMLTGGQYEVPITETSTVKDVKVFLGKTHQGRDPRSFRLMFNGNELKVRNQNRAWSLLECNIRSGSQLQAVVATSKHGGKTRIEGLAVDRHGNAVGAESELGLDGGFTGQRMAVICCVNHFTYASAALKTMGFDVTCWTGTVPSVEVLEDVLSKSSQLWIISTDKDIFPVPIRQVIKNFHQRGGALYLWGDNDPYNVAVNTVIADVMPGIYLHGNYHACKYVHPRTSASAAGFDAHLIFTGVEKLFEGDTIARFGGTNPRLRFIMSSTEPLPALGICDDNLGGCGRLAIDVGFTRLVCSWDDAGTSKFVKNIAAWLCNLDSDWI